MRSSDTAYEPQGGGFAHMGEPSTPLAARAPLESKRAHSESHAAGGAEDSSRRTGIAGDGAAARLKLNPTSVADPARAAFERHTRLARRALHVPLARLTLVGDVPASFTSVDPALREAGAGTDSSAWRAFCERVARTAKVLCVADTRRLERRCAHVRPIGLRAFAGVPVTAPDGRILGAFCVADRHPREWSDDDVETLRDLAAAAAAQISLRSTVMEAERLARADAEVANARLRALQTVSDTALTHLTLDDLLRELLARVRQALDVDNVEILLLSEDGRSLCVREANGLAEEASAGIRVPIGQGIAGRIAATRRPLIVDDLRQVDVYSPILRERLRSLVGVPLVVEERVLGVIHVGTAEPHQFTEEDAGLLQHVADRIALAIEHARLYQHTQTALRQVEAIAAQLGQKAAELDTIIEAIPDGVYVCDATGRRTRVNAQGAAMLGLVPEQALGPVELYAETSRPHFPDGTPLSIAELPLSRALRGETRTDIRFAVTRPDTGKEVQILACCAPIRDDTGAITGAVTVSTDVTELTRLERQKDDFLSVASHEMRTPLTSLKILTQLTHRRLQRAGLAETQHIARMERSIQRMELLINDLLDSSRIESGRLALRVERCNLAPICRQIADEQMAVFDRAITLDLPAEPVEVEADPERIGQVLTNLLSNALKYSQPDCPVTLTMRADREHGCVRLSVRDEGAGIPPESLPHLFERFYRVPGVQVQSGSGVGLGLGLFISKEIVQRHGGVIDVSSAVGAGTTFTVTLSLDC